MTRNTHLMAKEYNAKGVLRSTFTAEYTEDEMAEVFTTDQLHDLAEGKVIERSSDRYSRTKWVSLTALGLAALA